MLVFISMFMIFSVIINIYWVYLMIMLIGLIILMDLLDFLSISFVLGFNFLMDYMSYMLIFLSFFILFYVMIMEMKKMDMFIFMMLSFMLMFLILCFLMDSLFNFYVFFEASLVPLIVLMLTQGGSTERFLASVYLLVYTMLGSLFLLLFILIIKNNSVMIEMNFMFNKGAGLIWQFMLLVFLIKTPLYGVHMWLPKAHVEGPVSCSMLLAGILLKLGGYGLVRVYIFMNCNYVKSFNNFVMVVSILGALFVSFICFRQIDLKILIAYSSISHMGLMLAGLLSLTGLGIVAGIMMMLAHGFCSSALFFMGNMLYERCKTRNMFLYKGIYSAAPFMISIWMLLCVCNMGSPPFLNFFCELMLLICVLSKSMIIILPVVMFLMGSVFYSLNLFLRAGHGSSWLFFYLVKESMAEMIVLTGHIMFLIILVFKFNLIIYLL